MCDPEVRFCESWGKATSPGYSTHRQGDEWTAGPGQRWSLTRKREVALRLLRGGPVEALSCELGGWKIHRPEKWREKALDGFDNDLREREGDPLNDELEAAVKRVGELLMEVELLRERCRRNAGTTLWPSGDRSDERDDLPGSRPAERSREGGREAAPCRPKMADA